jgi:hypothetical protein
MLAKQVWSEVLDRLLLSLFNKRFENKLWGYYDKSTLAK